MANDASAITIMMTRMITIMIVVTSAIVIIIVIVITVNMVTTIPNEGIVLLLLSLQL